MSLKRPGVPRCFLVVTFALAILAGLVADTRAFEYSNANRFAYNYPTSVLPRGEHQYEQWVTWKTDKEADPEYQRLEFRQEFEHGISDRIQFGFYLATWRYTRTSEGSTTAVHDSGVELIYNISDPKNSTLGSALYGEVKFDSRLIVFEGKLLLEKYVGPWLFAYNGVLEQEWEGDDYADSKGEIKNIFSVSARLSSRIALGAEYLWEIETEDWNHFTKAVSYLGPNVALASPGWWIAVTSLFKVSDQRDEPGFQVRAKLGIPF